MTESGDIDLYEALGEAAGCRKLAEAFYTRVGCDPVLQPIYPASSHCAIDALTAFFIQIFGGSNVYSESRYWLSLCEAHARFRIGPAERDAWLRDIKGALGDIGVEEPVRGIVYVFFEHSSAYIINHAEPPAASTPGGNRRQSGLEKRWAAQQMLDEIVSAVRARDARSAIALAESAPIQAYREGDRAAFVSMLVVMMRSGMPELLDYVRQNLVSQPDLVHARHYYGRTLLHDAAGIGNADLAEFLIALNADPKAADNAGHTPLYCAGNEQGNESVVLILARAGANVNAQDKVKRCAPLHMAARRGNVSVAGALLDSGANIEVRDANGETPLRRAVNCAKIEVARLLLSRGADARSVGSKGLTAREAARSAAMKKLFV